ncbi:E3 ubiquitin-protein ligase rfwd3.L-like [Drosophila takahashii]|uniref:E3 ubiquitin-protein ligase rfwd3.L-like n=1 Tax=Drosophila takahashii TaxID=29030 RepID=UPI001CF922F5|nr:E3 ubiquitin-protein ligase RNF8-like [Drosophila takahashii]XP_016997702.2 E3 ubiquitin-protein ligase RNF8-like [Drosophila takahashii]
MSIQKNSLDLDDAYDAEEFQWLIEWYNHFYLAADKDDPALRMKKLKLKLRQTKDQLKDALRTNQELRRNNEKLAYDFYTQKLKLEEGDKKTPLSVHRDQEQQITLEQLTHELQFVITQKEQLTIERDGMILQLEEQEARYKGMVDKLEQQIHSMQVIISESQQEICQKEEMRSQLLLKLENQAQMHLQQIGAQNPSLEETDVDSITCPICWEAWDAEGSHRVVSLACGHLFGDACIRSYIVQSANCPICRQAADIQDIRRIFGRQVMPNPAN